MNTSGSYTCTCPVNYAFSNGTCEATNACNLNLDAGRGTYPNGLALRADVGTLADTAPASHVNYSKLAIFDAQVTNTATLDGALAVRFINGFQTAVTPSESFTVLTAGSGLSGAFANTAQTVEGQRIYTADGAGSFGVSYVTGPTGRVVLTTSVPPSIRLVAPRLTTCGPRPAPGGR